jgi:hypothetical protein
MVLAAQTVAMFAAVAAPQCDGYTPARRRTSATEAPMQDRDLVGGGVITVGMLAAYMVTALALNFAHVFSYRRSGLVASVLIRQAEYLVWHIAYGSFLYGRVA